jgi:2',3'-cyclic-nucleotide 2'-phosphodiesterase (5'-nucleotidase family)
MLRGFEVVWAGTARRIAKNIGVASRPDVQAIVDAANEETAELRNEVIGTQRADILRDPTHLNESAMGNLVADAMRDKYPASTPRSPTREACVPTCSSRRRRPASSPVRSRGARCSRCCRSATAW